MKVISNPVYAAKPKFGGWVSFTAHLLNSIEIGNLFKISPSNSLETKARNYGYGLYYQNIPYRAINTIPIFVLALDKHHYNYILDNVNRKLDNNKIVIHDNIEVMNKDFPSKLTNRNIKIITIRKEISDYIRTNSDVDSTFLLHPFYQYPKTNSKTEKKGAISVCRIDFDKHQEIMCEANKQVTDEDNKLWMTGALNRIYYWHKLKDIGFDNYYLGGFDREYNSLSERLDKFKFMVDLTAIKNDGGGTQYTFLEAIYHNCTLVLNRKWLDGFPHGDFRENYNCYAVSNASELAELLNNQQKLDTTKINNNAKKLLQRHIDIIPEWKKHLLAN